MGEHVEAVGGREIGQRLRPAQQRGELRDNLLADGVGLGVVADPRAEALAGEVGKELERLAVDQAVVLGPQGVEQRRQHSRLESPGDGVGGQFSAGFAKCFRPRRTACEEVEQRPDHPRPVLGPRPSGSLEPGLDVLGHRRRNADPGSPLPVAGGVGVGEEPQEDPIGDVLAAVGRLPHRLEARLRFLAALEVVGAMPREAGTRWVSTGELGEQPLDFPPSPVAHQPVRQGHAADEEEALDVDHVPGPPVFQRLQQLLRQPPHQGVALGGGLATKGLGAAEVAKHGGGHLGLDEDLALGTAEEEEVGGEGPLAGQTLPPHEGEVAPQSLGRIAVAKEEIEDGLAEGPPVESLLVENVEIPLQRHSQEEQVAVLSQGVEAADDLLQTVPGEQDTQLRAIQEADRLLPGSDLVVSLVRQPPGIIEAVPSGVAGPQEIEEALDGTLVDQGSLLTRRLAAAGPSLGHHTAPSRQEAPPRCVRCFDGRVNPTRKEGPEYSPAPAGIDSRSRIKRLRGLAKPQYRLRVGDLRIFYDVRENAVEVLAIVPKSQAARWLEAWGEAP